MCILYHHYYVNSWRVFVLYKRFFFEALTCDNKLGVVAVLFQECLYVEDEGDVVYYKGDNSVFD